MTYAANAACPRCRRPPATRYESVLVEWARALPPDQPIENVACTRPGCGTVYAITARHLQSARQAEAPKHRVYLAKRRMAA